MLIQNQKEYKMNIAEKREVWSLSVSCIDTVNHNNRHKTNMQPSLKRLREDDLQNHSFYLTQ